jgi:hypothetical protein
MTKHKPILLDEITYNLISKLAKENGRTRAGQVRIMADAFDKLGIQSVTLLPRPPGANVVPVINVTEREDK